MSVVDATFAAFHARRAEAQRTEDCADSSSDLSDEDFDESRYVELDAAFADFGLAEATSGAKTKAERRTLRQLGDKVRREVAFKRERAKVDQRGKKFFWPRKPSPAFPLVGADGNPVATAPWPIEFKGNWLWKHIDADTRYMDPAFSGCAMAPEPDGSIAIHPVEWHRVERCRNQVIIDTAEAPSFSLFGSYTRSVGIIAATLLGAGSVVGASAIVSAILADLGLVGSAAATAYAANTAALYALIVGSSAVVTQWAYDYSTNYRKNCASFAMTMLKGYIGCYSEVDIWRSIALPVECKPNKTMLQKGLVEPCDSEERILGVYKSKRGVGIPNPGEKGAASMLVLRYQRGPRSQEIISTLVGNHGRPYATDDSEQVEYGQNYREWAEERNVKWNPAWSDARGQTNWDALEHASKEAGVRIPGTPTAPDHVHGFEGLALLLGNRGVPFEMYSLMHRMKDRYSLQSSIFRAGLNPAKLTGAFNSWLQRRMGHAMVGFAFRHKIDHETEEYEDADGTKRTRTTRIRFVPCERYGVVVGGNPEGPEPIVFNTEDEEKLRAALRGDFPHWVNDQDEKEYQQYIDQLVEQARPTHADGWRLKDIVSRIVERGQRGKNEGAFRNRLGVRLNDQLHAEFMPLETIIPLAQTFYHPDYPDTHALRERVHGVISACARTPEIPVDVKAAMTSEWYVQHAAEYPTVANAQAQIEKQRALEEAAAAEVQRAAVHHRLSRDQLFDITEYLKLTWKEHKRFNEQTRKTPLWWYDSSKGKKTTTAPVSALMVNFLTRDFLPAHLFAPPAPVPKPSAPRDPRNPVLELARTRGNKAIWNKYDEDLQAHRAYLEDVAALRKMTAARIRDLEREFLQAQWEFAEAL